MAQLKKISTLKSRAMLAMRLGYNPKAFTYILYKVPPEQRYTTFPIPKRGGGERIIAAPAPHLKAVQRRLATLLQDCVGELEKDQPNRRRVTHGFQRGRTIVTNASAHRGRRYVLNLDLRNFFSAVNFGRVRGFFMKDTSFELPEQVATSIAHIACLDGKLPQGSPCSPVISNLVAHILDIRLLRFARRTNCRYTRYADDITFSTNAKEFPKLLASRSTDAAHIWELSEELVGLIERAGFEINPAKTRMQIHGSRQETTGLIVNDIVNVKREYTLLTRAMCHRLFKTGSYQPPIQPGSKSPPKETSDVSILEGRLSHIHFVKQFSVDSDNKKKTKQANQTLFQKLYSNFLFYKHFVALEKPLIVTEGPSDRLYLKAALKSRAAQYPQLATKKHGSIRGKILVPSTEFRNLMQLSPGTTGIGDLIRSFSKRLKQYEHTPCAAPIILLVDNDKSSEKSVFGVAHAREKIIDPKSIAITVASDDRIHFLGHNLYLIKTPHSGKKETKIIENLFPNKWLEMPAGGKKLDLAKKHGDHKNLGKVAFASRVILPNLSKIDCSGFDPLFDLIMEVLADYAKRKAA